MREVPLYDGRVALVDDEDFDLVAHYRFWHVNRHGSVASTTGKGTVLMHALVMGVPGRQRIIHRNGDKLDNRRSNLALATLGHQIQRGKLHANKTSRYLGVSWHKQAGKWHARIWRGRGYYLGLFADERDAAAAYNAAALDLFGPLARLNDLGDDRAAA